MQVKCRRPIRFHSDFAYFLDACSLKPPKVNRSFLTSITSACSQGGFSMRPLMNPTHKSQTLLSRITIRAAAKLAAIFLIAVVVPVALYVRVKSEDSAKFSKADNTVEVTKRSKGQVTVHAAGRGQPFLNLQDGHQMSVTYKGEQAAVAALQSGAAQGRALAAADIDGNGTPDVMTAYAYNGAGIITVQRGNPEAFAPADDSVLVRIQQGYNPPSLLPNADVYSVP